MSFQVYADIEGFTSEQGLGQNFFISWLTGSFFRSRVGGTKKKKKKKSSENDQLAVHFQKFFFYYFF